MFDENRLISSLKWSPEHLEDVERGEDFVEQECENAWERDIDFILPKCHQPLFLLQLANSSMILLVDLRVREEILLQEGEQDMSEPK
jgi:hypothetical protein